MQYLISVIHDQAGLATPDEQAAIDVFNERLQAEGNWVFAGGLAAPDAATVIDNRGEQALVTDGPFVESKEYLAGFWIVEAPDLDVALRLAAGLVDRIEVMMFPAISGRAGEAALFHDGAEFDLDLIESTVLDGRTHKLVYAPHLHQGVPEGVGPQLRKADQA